MAIVFAAYSVLFGQQKGYMQADNGDFLSAESAYDCYYSGFATVLGSSYYRTSIVTITFLDKNSVDEIPNDAWDVSEEQDESVVAWVETAGDEYYDLYIAGNKGVYANEDASYLFSGYVNLTEINFNDCFYTDEVTDMSYMFFLAKIIEDLDISFLIRQMLQICKVCFMDVVISLDLILAVSILHKSLI